MQAPTVDLGQRKIALTQLRSLICDSIMKKLGTKNNVQIRNAHKVQNVVFCFVPGLLEDDFQTSQTESEDTKKMLKTADGPLTFFQNKFDHLSLITMPGSKDTLYLPLQAMVHFPLTKKEKQVRAEELRKSKLVLYDLLLTHDQMTRNNYPIHSTIAESELGEGWVETQKFDHEGSHTFALDCEFCQADSGKVLARISVINFQNEVVYDSVVKPSEPITDYLTKYSGITPEMLADATVTLEEVQKKLLETISTKDILIGHLLESDLNVLKVRHPRIIDTALVYDHHCGPPLKPGLRWLAKNFLVRDIQQGEQTGMGHSSVEDLAACLDLVKLKLIEGPDFGKAIREVSIFERMKDEGFSGKCILVDYFPLAFGEVAEVDTHEVCNDDEVVANATREVAQLLILRFRELDFNRGEIAVPKKFTGCIQLPLTEDRKVSEPASGRNDLLKLLNSRLETLYEALPTNTCIVLCTECGDTREMLKLQGIRRRFQQLEREGKNENLAEQDVWDFDKLSALQRATLEARKALCFVGLKTEDTQTGSPKNITSN